MLKLQEEVRHTLVVQCDVRVGVCPCMLYAGPAWQHVLRGGLHTCHARVPSGSGATGPPDTCVLSHQKRILDSTCCAASNAGTCILCCMVIPGLLPDLSLTACACMHSTDLLPVYAACVSQPGWMHFLMFGTRELLCHLLAHDVMTAVLQLCMPWCHPYHVSM